MRKCSKKKLSKQTVPTKAKVRPMSRRDALLAQIAQVLRGNSENGS